MQVHVCESQLSGEQSLSNEASLEFGDDVELQRCIKAVVVVEKICSSHWTDNLFAKHAHIRVDSRLHRRSTILAVLHTLALIVNC